MPSTKTTKRSTLLSKRKYKNKEVSAKAPKAKTPKAPKAPKSPKSPKSPKVRVNKKVTSVKVSKEKTTKVEKKSKRKINMNPTLSDKAGLNISVARVKNIVDTFIINREEFVAASEVRQAYHPTEKSAEGKVKELPAVPLSTLSNETKDLITKAKHFYDRSDKEEFERTKVGEYSVTERAKYSDAKKTAKDVFEETMRLIPEFERGVFDVEKFNLSYDKNFYNGFTEAFDDSDEWQRALSHLSKLRVRFSANSKILLSSFIELLLSQLAVNGTYNCIQNKKKIIKLSHALQINSKTTRHFPLFSLVSNTQTYRKFKESEVKESEDDEGEVEEVHEDEDEDEDSSRPNFRFYVSEICRDVRMKLASSELSVADDSTEDKEFYNLTNVSRDFKDFCNSLIFETVTILGRMILTEINTRGVKTLNDVIMKTVIEHLHSAYGMDFKTSLAFIETSTKKYNSFVKNRRESRKAVGAGTSASVEDGYDIDYTDE
jgi:hypothetical protein